jgi:hypothetical protein
MSVATPTTKLRSSTTTAFISRAYSEPQVLTHSESNNGKEMNHQHLTPSILCCYGWLMGTMGGYFFGLFLFSSTLNSLGCVFCLVVVGILFEFVLSTVHDKVTRNRTFEFFL